MSLEKLDEKASEEGTLDLKQLNGKVPGRVPPPDYEKILLTRKDELRQDEFPNLLLFPQQDVIVKAEALEHRTVSCTVPDKALELPTTLFTHECLKFYSSQWERVTYNFAKYSGSYAVLLDEEAREALPHLTFERDQLEADAMKEETDGSLKRVSKSGYLSKGLFPGDQGTSTVTAKSYRKNWFELKPSPQGANPPSSPPSYVFMYYGDDKSSTSIKGMIPVETINEIKKNSKHKPYGFDLLSEDSKTTYPLAADSDKEMEEWIDVLKKAFGLDNEEATPMKPVYNTDTLKGTTKRSLLRPELLQYSEGSTDKENRLNRQSDRNDTFILYPELLHQPPPEAEEGSVPPPKEINGVRIHVVCKNLLLRLSLTKSGISQLLEPFFIRLALYDAHKGIKISEDFHIDLNETNLRSLLPKRRRLVRVGLDYEEVELEEEEEEVGTMEATVNAIKEAVFSVLFPNPDVYLVAKVEKVLHGTIQSCAEPYQKSGGDVKKTVDKLSKQMGGVCGRLGQYRMPFAWTARPLFGGNGFDQSAEFSPLYRQDKERISDEELLKLLSDYKGIGRYKLPVIAGNLDVSVSQFNGHSGMILNPSYLPLKMPSQQQSSSVAMVPAVKEVREFTPFLAYEPHSHYDPHLSMTHNLYVYPLSLNYETQKQFTKARNIAVKVEFKESDYGDSPPLKVIYSRAIGDAFTTKALSHVLYHSQSPNFYEEVKIKLPIRLSRRHHVLITLLHVSCEMPKGSKGAAKGGRQPPVETVVGYAWIPLLETDGKIINNVQSLPVATSLPQGYLSSLRGDLKKSDVPTPHILWVDNAKLLFKVRLKLDSTIYTEDSELFTFFAVCDHIQRGKTVPVEDLRFAIESLNDVDLLSLFHAPVLFNMLLRLLCFSQEPVPLVKLEVTKVLVGLIDKLVSAERQDLVKGYIEYMFATEIDPLSGQAIHDELVALLIEYLTVHSKRESRKFLNFVSFFFDITLKSMAQYLGQVGKENASRKSRYPDEFGANLEALIELLIPNIIACHALPTGTRANQALGNFLKHCFSFMDRGVVFRIVAKCLDQFDSESSKEDVVLMKLDFLGRVCEHEHFIPLNLPFKQKAVDILYELNEEYCQLHYLAGLLLTEVEKSLDSSSSTIRQRGVAMLRNLLAKIDSDERFATPSQKGRIATLFFPLVTMAINNYHRLPKGTSPADNRADKWVEPQSPSSLTTIGEEGSITSSTGSAKKSLIGDMNTVAKSPGKSPATGSDVDGVTTPTQQGKPLVSKQSMTSISSLQQSSSSNRHTLKDHRGDTMDVKDEFEYVEREEEEGPVGGASCLGTEETRDLLVCLIFVLNHVEQRVLEHWWVVSMDRDLSRAKAYSWSTGITATLGPQLETFFDILELCVRTFEYTGRLAITKKWSKRAALLKQLEQTYTTPSKKSKGVNDPSRRSFAAGLTASKSRISRISSSSSFIGSAHPNSPLEAGPEDMELYIRTEGNLSNEVGLTVLETLEQFIDRFKNVLEGLSVNDQLNRKIVSVLCALLEINQSTLLLTHIFASLKSYIYKFSSVLYRGNPDYCGAICYQLLMCSNSSITTTKAEASALLYLLMRRNYEYFNKQQGFVRTDLQMTKSLSKIATASLPMSYSSLRRSLGVIVTYAESDSRVQVGSFVSEVRDLMIRLRTVLSSTSQMKEHRNDPEKLLDLQYSLAKSYANSPELRHTWLESMALLHIEHKNYSEAAQCYLHIAGLVAEYMKVTGKYSSGSRMLRHLSYNIEKEESGMRLEKGASREQRYTEVDLVTFLESSMSLLQQSQHYELTTNVFQLLLPYYQEQKNYKKLTEMYGQLHECHKKILSVMETGRRYLGAYFRVGFYGQLFGEDNQQQFIYREPNVTGLAAITQRLTKLFSRKFGPDVVQVLQEAGKVDVDKLDSDKAVIQITHVLPYFTEEELLERTSKFEREHSLSKFIFEVPFTPSGGARGDIRDQFMRKTQLTTSHWFPYIIKRVPILDEKSWEISPIEVAIEAISKKRDDLLMEVSKRKHDLVKLQLMLQGGISPQVNQGALEYANVFLKGDSGKAAPTRHTNQLKDVYRSFMQLCEGALGIHGQIMDKSQALLHQDMMHKFQIMSSHLAKIIDPPSQKVLSGPHNSLQLRTATVTSPRRKGDPTRSTSLYSNGNPTTL